MPPDAPLIERDALRQARAPERRSSSALCKQRSEGATLEGETTNRQRYARAAGLGQKRSSTAAGSPKRALGVKPRALPALGTRGGVRRDNGHPLFETQIVSLQTLVERTGVTVGAATQCGAEMLDLPSRREAR